VLSRWCPEAAVLARAGDPTLRLADDGPGPQRATPPRAERGPGAPLPAPLTACAREPALAAHASRAGAPSAHASSRITHRSPARAAARAAGDDECLPRLVRPGRIFPDRGCVADTSTGVSPPSLRPVLLTLPYLPTRDIPWRSRPLLLLLGSASGHGSCRTGPGPSFLSLFVLQLQTLPCVVCLVPYGMNADI